MRARMTIKEVRSIVRDAIKAELTEAVVLTPTMSSLKRTLTSLDAALGTKVGVLFSRMLSRRISIEEADQLADEIRGIIARVGGASATKLTTSFDGAYEDAKEEQVAASSIGGMISSTLQAAQQREKPQTFSFKSIAQKPA